MAPGNGEDTTLSKREIINSFPSICNRKFDVFHLEFVPDQMIFVGGQYFIWHELDIHSRVSCIAEFNIEAVFWKNTKLSINCRGRIICRIAESEAYNSICCEMNDFCICKINRLRHGS